MQFLQSNERKWGRDKLLSSRSLTSGSGMNWSTPKKNSRSGRRQSTSLLPSVSDDSSPSKENDGGGAMISRANNAGSFLTPPSSSRKGGRKNNKSSRPSTSRNSDSDRIFVDSNTLRAIQTEVDNLPLPATLANICLALNTANAVLEAHADADSSRRNDDDNSMKSFEIMGTYMNEMSLSPTQKRSGRMDDFKSACLALVPGGNSVMLKSWEEVKGGLSEAFLLSKLDIIEVKPNDAQEQAETTATSGNIPTLSNRRRNRLSFPKRMPKKAHHRSPKRSRPSMTPGKALTAAAQKAKGFITLESFREQIKNRMGTSLFRQIYQQGEILPTKPSIAKYDQDAARLDEQIAQKESERRSTQRIDQIIAAKKKADMEREAKESAMMLMRTLTPDEQHIVNSAIRGIGPEAQILASQDADSVQRGSMQTLRPGQWLNDEIINYFLKNCLAKRDENLCAKQPGRKRSHFFNSFFVQTMFDEKNNNVKLRGRYNYKNVKRWGKKVPGKDIFNLKYIVCPINLDNMHWTSAVIFMEEKKIQYYDSMGGTDRTKLEGLLQYLKDEYKAKKGEVLDTSEWNLVNCTRDTPSQRNGFDCGVFTCMFCDFISKDCPLVFNQEHINQCRERIALSIMKNCAVE